MLLKADVIAQRLNLLPDSPDRIVIRPKPVITGEKLGSASVDLRLGCWFGQLRRSRMTHFDIGSKPDGVLKDARPLKTHYVPFGQPFILHPRDFVLAVTLEWIRMPSKLAGYVIGRSSWGRRGLIIETAAGVHPGFTGCLTLELSNVGQVPIKLHPGLEICQLFFHDVNSTNPDSDNSAFIGYRRPVLGEIRADKIAEALAKDGF